LGDAMTQATRDATAFRRAADALLVASGARSVLLRTPAPAIAGDPGEQLGLAVPEFQDVELSPAVFRTASSQGGWSKPASRDLIVSATAVQALTGSSQFASANALFASAFGVLVDDVLLAILGIADLEAGGQVYAYRLSLREPIQDAP
jgi:hypothetical protein